MAQKGFVREGGKRERKKNITGEGISTNPFRIQSHNVTLPNCDNVTAKRLNLSWAKRGKMIRIWGVNIRQSSFCFRAAFNHLFSVVGIVVKWPQGKEKSPSKIYARENCVGKKLKQKLICI